MIPEIKKAAEDKMKKTIETLRNDLGKIRTGRAHAGMLDHIMVDYYGTPTALTGVANVNLLDARTDRCDAVGAENGLDHRKSDPRFGSRLEPIGGRGNGARADARINRGTS